MIEGLTMSIKKMRKYLARKFKKVSVPLKKQILFESSPDVSGNTYMIYKELIERNVNKKYKLLWVVSKMCIISIVIQNVL